MTYCWGGCLLVQRWMRCCRGVSKHFTGQQDSHASVPEVVENDKHPQTLTEETGDANWETTHVTFDHGGKVPYIEGPGWCTCWSCEPSIKKPK